jgi:phage terminase Nu1 subunit (DNA packaging protein)
VSRIMTRLREMGARIDNLMKRIPDDLREDELDLIGSYIDHLHDEIEALEDRYPDPDWDSP